MSIIIWILFITLIQLPLILLGWILIPPMAYFKVYYTRKSWCYDYDILAWKWNWFNWVYGNEEDSILNGEQYSAQDSDFKQIVYWSANRNPVNNLRIVPYLTCIVDPIRVKYIGNLDDVLLYDTKIPQWFFCWQGLYSDFYWQFNFRGHLYRAWIGWKLYPTDIYGVTEYRKYGTGFALQFNKVI